MTLIPPRLQISDSTSLELIEPCVSESLNQVGGGG